MTDFQKYALTKGMVSPLTFERYSRTMDAYINPSIIEERRLNIASMDVFSRLMMDRIIFLGVPIDADVANIIQAQLLYLESVDSNADISLYINTPGGEVAAGLAIYDTMQLISPKVNTICTGIAASMGAVLLCAGEKEGRTILPHGKVMIHQPLGEAHGQASDILIAARQIKATRDELCSIIANHCGKDKLDVLTDADRDFWMNAEEAKSYGLVDRIIRKR